MAGWRAQVSFQRRLASGRLRPCVGAGPSWTSEEGEQDSGASLWGGMALLGLEVSVLRRAAGTSTLAAFVELDAYTHSYATGQAVVGLRLASPR